MIIRQTTDRFAPLTPAYYLDDKHGLVSAYTGEIVNIMDAKRAFVILDTPRSDVQRGELIDGTYMQFDGQEHIAVQPNLPINVLARWE